MKHRISAIIITLFAGVLAVFAGNIPPQTVRHHLWGIDLFFKVA